MDEIYRVVICKNCGKPEYYGKFRWISGRQLCRDCYKAYWEDTHDMPYIWSDLDGERPTLGELKGDEYD